MNENSSYVNTILSGFFAILATMPFDEILRNTSALIAIVAAAFAIRSHYYSIKVSKKKLKELGDNTDNGKSTD